jgi:class 3 adenylate cyclase
MGGVCRRSSRHSWRRHRNSSPPHSSAALVSTEYTAIGTVVNLSARVCAIAAGGQILGTNKVFAGVEDRVDAIPMGDVEFKGLSRPVPIVEITALR